MLFDGWGSSWGYGGVGLGMLAQRYAHGEIERAESAQKRRDLDAL